MRTWGRRVINIQQSGRMCLVNSSDRLNQHNSLIRRKSVSHKYAALVQEQ